MSTHPLARRGTLAAILLSLAAAPDAAAQRIELWGGAGAVTALSQPGRDREVGPAVMGALDVRGHDLPVGVRLEAGFASQALRARSDALLTGDVQTAHAAAAVRIALRSSGSAPSPYVLAGAAVLRHSTRTELRRSGSPVPDGRFVATTSEVAPGVLLGAGLDWRLAGVRGYAELRWMRSATDDGHTSTLPLIIGARLPIRD